MTVLLIDSCLSFFFVLHLSVSLSQSAAADSKKLHSAAVRHRGCH